MIALFLKGFFAGFIIAVPLGPVGLLCFRRVLTRSLWVGIATVLGTSFADMLYGSTAAFGVGAITTALIAHKVFFKAAGGLFLIGFGAKIITTKPADPLSEKEPTDITGPLISAFVLVLANPVLLISYIGVCAALDLGAIHRAELSWFSPGIFLGSAAWWFIHKATAALWGDTLKKVGLKWIDLGAGIVICGFGVWQLIDCLINK